MKPVNLRIFTLISTVLAFNFALTSLQAKESALLAIPGKVLYQNKFDTSPEATWQAAKGDWKIANGVLRGAELVADKHGAVIRLQEQIPDFVIDTEFKFEGGKSISLSINAVKDHMARILITPKAVTIRKDDNDHDGPDKVVVFAVFPIDWQNGTWHRIHLEMVDDTLLAKVDDLVAWGSAPLFKEQKANPGLTVAGQSADFRNFSIHAATLNPKWNAVKKTLAQPGKKSSAAQPKGNPKTKQK
jgi:hypothetical protein